MTVVLDKQSLVKVAGTRGVRSATPIAILDGLAQTTPSSNAQRIARRRQQTLACIAERMVTRNQSFVEPGVGPEIVAEAGAVQRSLVTDAVTVTGDEAATPRHMQ